MIFDLAGRLFEIPYRLRRPHCLRAPLANVSIAWPRVYQWPPNAGIVVTLRDALSRAARLMHDDIPQVHRGMIVFQCDGHQIVLDYLDYHNFVNEDALKGCDLYIKLQYRSEGYADSRMIPGGYIEPRRTSTAFTSPFETGEITGSIGTSSEGLGLRFRRRLAEKQSRSELRSRLFRHQKGPL